MTHAHALDSVRAVIVDPYSSGALLADALATSGVRCLAVESTATLPCSMKSKFVPGRFSEVIQHTDLASTVRRLQAYRPTHVVAGFESGVELAEQLGSIFKLETNDPAFSSARRDKSRMHEIARQSGLRTPRQFCSGNVEELVEWARENLDWPVIVKPPQSAASDRVTCCHTCDEVAAATSAILNEVNILGIANTAAIVQEFVDGTEYALDFVCYRGRAKLTAVWQYERMSGSDAFVPYHAMRLIDYEGKRQHALHAYAIRLLEALGIRFGPAHCELIWNHAEPVLVEVGARMSAGINAVLSRTCGGIGQLDETVNVILRPDDFLATFRVQPCLTQYAANVFLRPHRPGTLITTRYVDRLQQLSTFQSMSLATRPGQQLTGVAGRVTLVGHDADAMQRDMAKIRDLERIGIFQLQDDPTIGTYRGT